MFAVMYDSSPNLVFRYSSFSYLSNHCELTAKENMNLNTARRPRLRTRRYDAEFFVDVILSEDVCAERRVLELAASAHLGTDPSTMQML